MHHIFIYLFCIIVRFKFIYIEIQFKLEENNLLFIIYYQVLEIKNSNLIASNTIYIYYFKFIFIFINHLKFIFFCIEFYFKSI